MNHESENQQEPVKESNSHNRNSTSKWYHKVWRVLSSLHPAWYVSIGLTFLVTMIILHYEYREYRIERQSRFSVQEWYEPYESWHFHRATGPWNMFDRQMEYIEDRHDRMMRQMNAMMQEISTRPVGQYIGFRNMNTASSSSYSLHSIDGNVNGTITLSGTGWLRELKKSIETLGYNVVESSDSLMIAWKSDNLQSLIQLLGN